MCNEIIRRKEKRMEQKKHSKPQWLRISQSTEPRGLENTKQNKCRKGKTKQTTNKNNKNYA